MNPMLNLLFEVAKVLAPLHPHLQPHIEAAHDFSQALDRAEPVSHEQPAPDAVEMEVEKVGAAVVAVRRAGAIHVFDSINHLFFISQMIVPGSSYWNIGVGREIGEVSKDEEGMQIMRTLGQNMAWLLKKIKA